MTEYVYEDPSLTMRTAEHLLKKIPHPEVGVFGLVTGLLQELALYRKFAQDVYWDDSGLFVWDLDEFARIKGQAVRDQYNEGKDGG